MIGDVSVGFPMGTLHFLAGQCLSNSPLMVSCIMLTLSSTELALYRAVQSKSDNSLVIAILAAGVTQRFEMVVYFGFGAGNTDGTSIAT